MLELDPELKTKWTTELRNPERKQTKGRLRQGDWFCCLGVLCEVAEIPCEGNKYWDEISEGFDSVGMLPPQLANQGDSTGEFQYAWRNHYESWWRYETHSLAELNDSGMPFSQIADLVERFF